MNGVSSQARTEVLWFIHHPTSFQKKTKRNQICQTLVWLDEVPVVTKGANKNRRSKYSELINKSLE